MGFPEWDHPRIRGEHDRHGLARTGRAGSSPHTRGARGRRRVGWSWSGIIPAYAGSTNLRKSDRIPSPDHPRIRGEHKSILTDRSMPVGSSPHTRGAPVVASRGCVPPRIIPAYAGSTSPCAARTAVWPDHPRIRGEHKSILTDRSMPVGSSPHTRGARGCGRRSGA